jgi:hypothetical protein
MTDEQNKPLIDASIFGAVGVPADAGAIPDFLVRTHTPENPVSNDDAQADHVQGGLPDGERDGAGQPHEDAASEESGDGYSYEQTEAGDQAVIPGTEALIGNAPSQIGHNNPPEEPLSKEEMLKDFNKDIAAYGKDSGRGASALPRLGLRVIRAAADGLISTEKPKDGTDSDAVRIYKRYAEQDSKHAEHTKGGMKANAAKLNALIGLGSMTTVDGVDVAQRCVDLRDKMEAAEQKPKALFAGLVDVARKQMEQDTPLTDDAIEAALGKTQKEKTVADEWAAIHKKIEKLVTGENGVKDQTEAAVKIEEMVREHVNNFTVNAEKEELVAFCMERGMSRAQAMEFVANK